MYKKKKKSKKVSTVCRCGAGEMQLLYLNDQVDVWRWVGDGENGSPCQCGDVRMRAVGAQ